MSNLPVISRRGFMAMPLILAGCKFGPAVKEVSGQTMGTTYNVVAVSGSSDLTQSGLRTVVESALAEVNAQLSNWEPSSEVSKFNAHDGADGFRASGMLASVVQAAADVHSSSLGRFDITAGPLIDLWGFGAKGGYRKPSDAEIAAAKRRVGHDRTLRAEGSTLRKTQPDTEVYLSAIGKGFGADHVGRALEAHGLTDFMVEIGGDLYASGRNPDGVPWQIGVEKPVALSGGVLDVVAVSGLGMASSGDYRNYFENDGKRFSHIIDPTTGAPITHRTASTTVLAENAMLADAWATAMLILGREKGLDVAREHDVAVLFVDRDSQAGSVRFKTWSSPRFDAITA